MLKNKELETNKIHNHTIFKHQTAFIKQSPASLSRSQKYSRLPITDPTINPLLRNVIPILFGYYVSKAKKENEGWEYIVFCLAVIMIYDGRPFDIFQWNGRAGVCFTRLCASTFH